MTFALFVYGGSGSVEEGGRSTLAEQDGAVVYPEGPYGVTLGERVDGRLGFDLAGPIHAGPITSGPLTMRDLFDGDGRRGNHAILVIEGAAWSSVCQSHAAHLRAVHRERLAPRGIVVLELLFEDEARRPARLDAAIAWATRYESSWLVGIDPQRKLPSKTVPTSYLIDPRTMRITHVFEGWDESAARLADDLAHRNRGR